MLSVLKLLSYRFYADNLIRNFSSAVADYLAIDTEEKRTIMRRHAYMGRMICCSILFFAYLAPLLFVVVSVIAGGEEDIQVNVSLKNQASELPMPLTFALGDSDIPTSIYLVITMVQYVILVLNSNGNCGNKLTVN